MRSHTRTRLLTRRGGRRRGRAAVLLEFMLIMPLFLFMVLFCIDMGRLMVVYGIVSDSTYVAARAGAQYGSNNSTGIDVIQTAFDNALDVNGLSLGGESELTVINGICTNANKYIITEARQPVTLITPGLSQLLGGFGDGATVDGDWVLQTRAVVLCEVIRG